MPFVVPAPGGTITGLESFDLDGLELNDRVIFYIRDGEVDMSPPRQRPEWIGAADSEWQSLVRNPLHENRVVVLPLQVAPGADKDATLNRLGLLQDMLATASQSEDGIPLVWSPAGSDRAITFDVLSGEITELPLDRLFSVINRPRVTVTLTCKPYWRGEETLTATASSSSPFVTLEIDNPDGEVSGTGRLIVTDTASQARRHVEWGLEGPLTYDPGSLLLIDSDSMVTSGFAGAQDTQSGAYDPGASGNNTVHATLQVNPMAVCGTGDLAHVGTFRVKMRAFSSLGRHRLAWQAGDGPMTANPWTPGYELPAAWREHDLGTITIPAGSGKWTGRVEAYAPGNASYGTYIDYLVLVPVGSGYGKARATYSYRAGVMVGYDDFTSTTAGNNLNARVAPTGGTWATAGDATDYQFADALSGEQVTRATISGTNGRLAVLGSTAYTNTEVEAKVYQTSPSATSSPVELGVVARWVDASNYLRGTFAKATVSGSIVRTLVLTQVVAGVTTQLAAATLPVIGSGVYYTVRLIVFTSGRAILTLFNAAGTTTYGTVETTTSVLATGGTLDDGKPGLFDLNPSTTAITRYYDDFSVSTPASEPVVIYSGRNLQVTDTDTIRQDSAGTYTGRPQSYRGSRFLVPVGTSRVLAKARRNDVDTSTDDNVTDATQIQCAITPRGLVVPRG